MKNDLLSVLSIYLRIFLCVFIVYCLLLGILVAVLYSTIGSGVLVVLVLLSVLANTLVRKTSLSMPPNYGEEITSTKPRWKNLFVFTFSFGLYMLLCVSFRPYTVYISCAHGTT